MWYCYGRTICIQCFLHFISILRLIKLQTNTDAWSQPSSLLFIIGTKLCKLSSHFMISRRPEYFFLFMPSRLTRLGYIMEHYLTLDYSTSTKGLLPYISAVDTCWGYYDRHTSSKMKIQLALNSVVLFI